MPILPGRGRRVRQRERATDRLLKPSWINLTSAQQLEVIGLLPSPGSWRVLPGTELPSVFPPTFREKIGSALVIAQPTSTGGTYLVFSAHRIDRPARAVDIEPFGLIVHSTGPSATGVYIHHGNWKDRTLLPPQDFWNEVSQSGVSVYYLTHPPGDLREGTLAQLPAGDRGAFDAVVRQIRARVDSRKE